jgi:hypothetical protein
VVVVMVWRLATTETLAGVHVLDDGILLGGMGGHDLEPHQKALVDRVAEFVADVCRILRPRPCSSPAVLCTNRWVPVRATASVT